MSWVTVFQGVSAANAAIQAIRATLPAHRPSPEEVAVVVATTDADAAVKIPRHDEPLDEDMWDVIDERIERAKKKWIDDMGKSSGQADDFRITDRYQSDLCAILRLIKQLRGGRLPEDLYPVWALNKCA